MQTPEHWSSPPGNASRPKNPSSNTSIRPPSWERLFWINSELIFTHFTQQNPQYPGVPNPCRPHYNGDGSEHARRKKKKHQTPKATFVKESCTPPAAMRECLMCISFHLMNSCSHQKRSRSPRNSWSHKAAVSEQVQSGVTPQCQRSSSCAIPVGLEQREAEQRERALLHSATPFSALRINPEEAQGAMALWTNLMQQLGWCSFRSC